MIYRGGPSLLLSVLPAPAVAKTFVGKVVSVTDGDTITVQRAGKRVTVELHGLDCPELKQPFGAQARSLTAKTVGKPVRVEVVGKDHPRRIQARVWVTPGAGQGPSHERRNEWSLNHALVSAGLAWSRNNVPMSELEQRIVKQTETLARQKNNGLFASPTAIEPWRWRAGDRFALGPKSDTSQISICRKDSECVLLPSRCGPEDNGVGDWWRPAGNLPELGVQLAKLRRGRPCRQRSISGGLVRTLGTRAVCLAGDCRTVHDVAGRHAAGPALRGDPRSKVYHSVDCVHYYSSGSAATFTSATAAVRAGYRAHTDCNPSAATSGLPTTGKLDYWKQQPECEAVDMLPELARGMYDFFVGAIDVPGKHLRPSSTRRDGKPIDSGWWPRRPCCRQKGKLCRPGRWDGPGWRHLKWPMSWSHSFQYRVTIRGKGLNARVTVEARGDPKCDGHAVRYRTAMTVDSKLIPRIPPAKRVKPAGPPP